ncbi:MAG: putative metal-binding integral rane protein [Nocardioidaceae bacterium]|nr:putative metal-binding integral rane protein [Nocardioidaceae bacterium]
MAAAPQRTGLTTDPPGTGSTAGQSSNAVSLSRGLLVIGVLVAVAASATAIMRPSLAPLAAGSVLLVAGFAVMAPCSMQMALTMARVVERTGAARGVSVRRTATLFALGYVGFYLPVAVVLGGLARLLGDLAWIAVLLGALVSLVLGLAALGTVQLGSLSKCRGPLWLLRTGRASFQRPVKAGVAFGQYCATCCGPYVLAIAVIAGGTHSFVLGSGLVVAYAMLMAVPFLAPAFLAPSTYAELGAVAGRLAPRVERATGVVLVGVSLALLPGVVAAVVG